MEESIYLGGETPVITARQFSIEFAAELVATLCRDLVYIVSDNGRALYVGRSAVGLGRVFNRNHHQLSGILKDGLTLTIIPCPDGITTDALERKLIEELDPKINDPRPLFRRKQTKPTPVAASLIGAPA